MVTRKAVGGKDFGVTSREPLGFLFTSGNLEPGPWCFSCVSPFCLGYTQPELQQTILPYFVFPLLRNPHGCGKTSLWFFGQHESFIGELILCSILRCKLDIVLILPMWQGTFSVCVFPGLFLAPLQRQPTAGTAAALAKAEDAQHDDRLPILSFQGRLLRHPCHRH